ncbi:MAG: CBS domain-containing protein [Methanosarcinales archaeon]
MKKVRDFMNPHVIYFKPEDSIFKVAKVFSKNNISGAPVVKRNKVIGIISECDIVKFMSSKLGKKSSVILPSLSLLVFSFIKDHVNLKGELKRISKTKIKHFMTKKVVSISPEASLLEAASVMEKNDINRLPVIDNEKLVGIIARADLIKALIE